MSDAIYTGTLSARITTPCGVTSTFTGPAFLRVGPIRDATVDSNPYYLSLAMNDPNIQLNLQSSGPSQYWQMNATSTASGYNLAGSILPSTNDGGVNRILAITPDGMKRLMKRDFCGQPSIYASFPSGMASIMGPITPQTANIAASLHTHAVHIDPNMQSQFYVSFVGTWDSTSAQLNTIQANRPLFPTQGTSASQAQFPTVMIADPGQSSGSTASTGVSGQSAVTYSSAKTSTGGGTSISSAPAKSGGAMLRGLTTGPIVGIIFGGLFVLVAVFLAGRWALLRHRRNKKAKKASVPAAGSVAPAFTPQMSYGYNTLHDAEAGDQGRRSVSNEPMLKSVRVEPHPEDQQRGYGGGPPHEDYSDHQHGQPSPGQAPRGNRDDPFADDADDADVPRIAVSHHHRPQ